MGVRDGQDDGLGIITTMHFRPNYTPHRSRYCTHSLLRPFTTTMQGPGGRRFLGIGML